MKISTTEGEIITIHQREIIWNALDYLTTHACGDDEIFIALQPRRPGIRVKYVEFAKLVRDIRYKFA